MVTPPWKPAIFLLMAEGSNKCKIWEHGFGAGATFSHSPQGNSKKIFSKFEDDGFL